MLSHVWHACAEETENDQPPFDALPAGPDIDAPAAHNRTLLVNYPARIGVDVGGTFTDVVMVTSDGQIVTFKLPSTPGDFSEGVVEGVAGVLRAEPSGTQGIRDVVHGSTVATNAILERKGARVGLLTTEGFRDVLELRRLRMPKLYDMEWSKPPPIVERHLRHTVAERINVEGEVVRALDLDSVRSEIDQLVAEGVESIAVSLLHSYANPEHEIAIGGLLDEEYPQVWTSLSHEILPVIREYERTSTTVLNAYVQPNVASYLQALRLKLDDSGVAAPVLIMQSNGGVMSSNAASKRPAYIVESGPAGGVIAAAALARSLGFDEVITFDMGGTTAKASLVEQGSPHFTAEFEVASGISAGSRLSSGGGYALSVPFIDLAEVGAGGGSIVWIDPAGAPKVGPTSAGADPGPVCYGKGGTHPTVTDANLLLGYLNPDGLLHGSMALDIESAAEVFEERVSRPLKTTTLDAAYGSHELANASMIRAIKAVSVQRGRDPREFTLVAFGGSGPVHAAGIARELGIRRIIIPPRPGVFSAVGLLRARLECHAKRTYLRKTRLLRREDYFAVEAQLKEEARAAIGIESLEGNPFKYETWAEMRYVGQGFELPVEAPESTDDWDSWLDELESRFADQHELTYGHRTDNPTELVHLRVACKEDKAPTFPDDRFSSSHEEGTTKRNTYFGEGLGEMTTKICQRGSLLPSPESGPMIIEDYDATTVVPPDFSVHRDDNWNIVIESQA